MIEVAPGCRRASPARGPTKKAPEEFPGGSIGSAPRAKDFLPPGVISRETRRLLANPIAVSIADQIVGQVGREIKSVLHATFAHCLLDVSRKTQVNEIARALQALGKRVVIGVEKTP
jgi:hypothetical protein